MPKPRSVSDCQHFDKVADDGNSESWSSVQEQKSSDNDDSSKSCERLNQSSVVSSCSSSESVSKGTAGTQCTGEHVEGRNSSVAVKEYCIGGRVLEFVIPNISWRKFDIRPKWKAQVCIYSFFYHILWTGKYAFKSPTTLWTYRSISALSVKQKKLPA